MMAFWMVEKRVGLRAAEKVEQKVEQKVGL